MEDLLDRRGREPRLRKKFLDMILDVFGTDADGLHMGDGVGHDLILDRVCFVKTFWFFRN